ncbi:unnamed protein product [Prunus armeniaca]
MNGWIECTCLDMTSLKEIVAERGTVLNRQVHGMNYKVVDWGRWRKTVGGFGWCSSASLDCEGCMIYGVDRKIIGMVLRHLENQGSYDILMDERT